MKEVNIYIDLDGVILNSQEILLDRKYKAGFINHSNEEDYYKYFEYTNNHQEEWDYIIREAKQLNNSIDIINELWNLKKKVAILTKIHTLYEMRVKLDDLRNHRKIMCPIMFVPPMERKCDVVIPNGDILVDDLEKNIREWKCNGGVGYLFDSNLLKDTNEKVMSLEFLLKR